MATGKEVRGKITSVESTKKITKAMQMVASAKMRKAQDRMQSSRPYCDKIRNVTANLVHANQEYSHPFLVKHQDAKKVGFIVITTDKGLCGGMNTNVLRLVTNKMHELEKDGISAEVVAIGSKGLSFLSRIGAKVVSKVTQLGDRPRLEQLIGPVKVLLDAYQAGELSQVYIVNTQFISTMKQHSALQQLLPLSAENLHADETEYDWDYIYEPSVESVVDELLFRFVEALIYQAVVENIASEQSARMVAMKAASDNAGNIIKELKLQFNKARQAAITTELSEIIAGAAAV